MMEGTFDICIEETRLLLLPERAVFFPESETLLVSDLHLGKAMHFRKHGIPVPADVESEGIRRLSRMAELWKPRKMIFLGDLFHSEYNEVWDRFAGFISGLPQIEFLLIRGNHDILSPSTFAEAGLHVVDRYSFEPFLLTHDRVETDSYNLHGHVHPAVRLKGLGRQSLRLPCFLFAENYGILPSFGGFTGSYTIKPKKGQSVYVPLEGAVHPLK